MSRYGRRSYPALEQGISFLNRLKEAPKDKRADIKPHDVVRYAFIQSTKNDNSELLFECKVGYNGDGGIMDVISTYPDHYSIIEFKSKNNEFEQAIGQLFHYRYCLSVELNIPTEKIELGIMCPDLTIVQEAIFNQLKIKVYKLNHDQFRDYEEEIKKRNIPGIELRRLCLSKICEFEAFDLKRDHIVKIAIEYQDGDPSNFMA